MLAVLIISCSEQKKKSSFDPYDPKAIELNNKAVRLMHQNKNDSAILVFDQAIEADKTYYMPHSNKVTIYVGQREYQKALQESELSIEKRPDLAEGWTMTGMLHEKLGDSITAAKYYQKSIDLFDERISDPKMKEKIVPNEMSKALSLILLGKEKEGKDILTKLKEDNPKNLVIEEFLKINRKEFINQYFL